MTPQQLTLLCKWLHSENWVGYMRSLTSNICTSKSPTIQSRLIYPSCKYNHIMKKWRKWNVKSSSPPGQGCRCMQQKLTPSQKVHFADDYYYLCWPPVSAQHLITYRFTVQYHTMLENSQYTYLTPPACRRIHSDRCLGLVESCVGGLLTFSTDYPLNAFRSLETGKEIGHKKVVVLFQII